MPNRKRAVGWYLLAKSRTPYHGPIPDGAQMITEAQVKKAAQPEEKP
jgi:hypothetical protein